MAPPARRFIRGGHPTAPSIHSKKRSFAIMTISRRQTLQLAAAFAAAHRPLFAVSPAAAAAMLDGTAERDVFMVDDDPYGMTVMDPTTFAQHMEGNDTQAGHYFANGAAAEWAAYKQALDRVIALDPERLDPYNPRTVLSHPVNVMDEAVAALSGASWAAGVVAGAAYEHLRLALTAPVILCACNGHGCEACGGSGTLPTPPIELGIATR
jgi:hypothetical protein